MKIWDFYYGGFGVVLVLFVPFWLDLGGFGWFGWFGGVWFCLVHFGIVWSILVLFGPFWLGLGGFGLVWSILE